MLPWPRERFHLQISLDGNPAHHDQIRGKGAFTALMSQLAWLQPPESDLYPLHVCGRRQCGRHARSGGTGAPVWRCQCPLPLVLCAGPGGSRPVCAAVSHLAEFNPGRATGRAVGRHHRQPGKPAQPGVLPERHHPRRPRQWLEFSGHRPGREDLSLPGPGGAASLGHGIAGIPGRGLAGKPGFGKNPPGIRRFLGFALAFPPGGRRSGPQLYPWRQLFGLRPVPTSV